MTTKTGRCFACGVPIWPESRACVEHYRLGRPSLVERFWAKVEKRDGCWLWTGVPTAAGYGMLHADRVAHYAHRLSWEIHFGPIPAGLHVCHHCDNPPCVRPVHLFLGTQADNLRDMAIKGRVASTKLTPEKVRAIRADTRRGADQQFAARYGVSRSSVYAARHRITWRHVA